MKKILSLAIVLAVAIFFACSEDPNGTQTDLSNTITILAQDATTGELLPAAKVTFVGIDEKAKPVDDKGTVQYKNIPIGTGYKIKIEAEDYAPMECEIDVEGTTINNVIVMNNAVHTITMFKNSVSVEGSLYYNDPENTGGLLPAKDAKLIATLSLPVVSNCKFAEPSLNITVGADGKYAFNVPGNSRYVLNAPEQEYDVLREGFSVYTTTVGNNPKGNTVPNRIVNNYADPINKGFFIKSRTKGVAGTKDPVKIVFSKKVKKFANFPKLSDIPQTTTIGAFEVDLDFDGTTLTITPAEGEKWDPLTTISIGIGSLLGAATSEEDEVIANLGSISFTVGEEDYGESSSSGEPEESSSSGEPEESSSSGEPEESSSSGEPEESSSSNEPEESSSSNEPEESSSSNEPEESSSSGEPEESSSSGEPEESSSSGEPEESSSSGEPEESSSSGEPEESSSSGEPEESSSSGEEGI